MVRVMTELNLELSERFDKEDAETMRVALSEHLVVGKPSFIFRRSAGTDLASFIQLLGDLAAWLPLSAAATVYLSTLAKHAGDATWNGLRQLLHSKEVKPLADVADTLATIANKIDGEVEIVVGLNIPDEHFGTAISIRVRDPVEISRILATFVVRIPELSKIVQAEVEAGRQPLGRVTVEIQDDSSLLVKWCSQADFKVHEKRIL